MRSIKNAPEQLKLADFADKSLLIVDDDDPLRGRLARAMEKKGFAVKEAKTVEEGLSVARMAPTAFAIVDLRLEDGNGLDVVKELSKHKKDSRIVMLTGYGNLPTAVAAVKVEHIHRVFELCNRNVSETARRLKMHRRTLQRILSKRSPR